MPKSSFVDFKAVKTVVTMQGLLEHYGLSDRFKRTGDSLSGPCPIHRGSNPTQFRISVSKNIWHCFSECKTGGNVLDFISRMEDVSIHAAAIKAMAWFHLDPEAMKGNSDSDEDHSTEVPKTDGASAPKPATQKTAPEKESGAPNKPLQFRLEKLERNHPYLAQRGLAPETIVEFGAGYCAKGIMAGRIAIPISNPEGNVVAYAGRWPGEPAEDTPKYKLPPGFSKSLELFNIQRAMKERWNVPLVIVEGFFAAMKLYQHGCRKVVALMGSTMSAAQEELIRKHLTPQSLVLVMLDEDDAGRAGREDIAVRLSRHFFVKVHLFDKPDMQPEHLSAEDVHSVLNH